MNLYSDKLLRALLSVVVIFSVERGLAGGPEPKGGAPVIESDVPEIGLAAFKGDVPMLRRLISAGANIEASGRDKRTPLILRAAALRYDAVKLLIEADANVNARDIGRATALHWAAIKGDEKIVSILLRHHADLNAQDLIYETPLICAAQYGNKRIVEALLAAGADPSIRDEDGRSAKDWARINRYADIKALLARPR